MQTKSPEQNLWRTTCHQDAKCGNIMGTLPDVAYPRRKTRNKEKEHLYNHEQPLFDQERKF